MDKSIDFPLGKCLLATILFLWLLQPGKMSIRPITSIEQGLDLDKALLSSDRRCSPA